MIPLRRTLLIAALLFATPFLPSQANESSIMSELRSLATATTPQSPTTMIKIASEIRTLPAGRNKLQLADILAHLASRDDPGMPALQAVADTLPQSLTEFVFSGKGDQPPMPYIDVGNRVQSGLVKVPLDYPHQDKAIQRLVGYDVELE